MSDLPSGTVTFLFSDIEGSTRLLQRHRDAYREVLEEHQRLLRSAFAREGGREIGTQGDSFFVAFPRAKNAVAAAVAAQRSLDAHAWPEGADVRVRMGLHTGEPSLGGDNYVGLGVHRAARICSAAHGGQVLVSGVTREIVEDGLPPGARLRDLGLHRLKDIERPERLYQLEIEGLRRDFPPLRAPADGAVGPGELSPDLVVLGTAALDAGDWSGAQASFEAALADEETAEALDGLGQALWWQNELGRAIELRERAYADFSRRGDVRSAIRLAVWLGREYFTVHGNFAASGGWIARAERLCAEAGACPECGWLELLKGFASQDAAAMRTRADAALAIAKQFDDADLETVAVSFNGLGSVYAADLEVGMAFLDEAMAAATGGELKTFSAVSDVYCNTLLACERAGDYERAEQWNSVVAKFARRCGCEPLFPYCHVTFGAVLTARGRWDEAENELELALRTFDAGHRAMRVLALARFADLRIRQGRSEEARELLAGYEEHPLALRPVARLHLERGELAEASSLLRRRLQQIQNDTLLAAPLLALLVEVQVAQDNVAAARETAAKLVSIGENAGRSTAVAAEAELALGRALAAGHEDAVPHLERAYLLFSERGQPLEAARAQLELARAGAATDRESAVVDATRARAAFKQLGAEQDTAAADQFLREVASGTVR